MEDFVRGIFFGEIAKQCDFALTAASEINAALKERQTGRVWYSLQAFLGAAANVSKLLWPQDKYRSRGEELRFALSVPDDSPLASRDLRNHFEHIDERLETWAESSVNRVFIDSNISDGDLANFIVGLPTNEASYLRNFNTSTMSVTFWGETHNLQPVVSALTSLRATVMEQSDRRFGS